MLVMGLLNHGVTLRDPVLRNAFFNTVVLQRQLPTKALQLSDPLLLRRRLPRTAATRTPLLRAPDTLCASATARSRPGHIRGTLALVVSVRSQFGAPLPV